MIDRDELDAWLSLLEAPQVGRQTARRLLTAFGSPQAVRDASDSAWREAAGVQRPHSAPDGRPSPEALVESTWQWLQGATAAPRSVVTLGDAQYPRALLETADPPLLLYVVGDVGLLNRPALAVVGSRNPTPQGVENARAFATGLGDCGWVIVSGLALGIDGAAHEGALRSTSGTIAVVGTGLDRVYPRRHLELARRIAAQGAIVSEFALGTPALAPNFPVRNRVIAGLAQGTLVVEAALQSGSLITARLAAEAGRDVFALPGSIHAPQSRGCHALIKQGAKLVDSVQDIVDELQPQGRAAPAKAAQSAGENTDPVLHALGHDPMTLDALVARTGWPAPELNARLLELELDGRVDRLPGQLFQRRVAA